MKNSVNQPIDNSVVVLVASFLQLSHASRQDIRGELRRGRGGGSGSGSG